MIEQTIQDYLTDALDVPVRMQLPENPSGSFVVLQRTGGGSADHLRRALLAAQSYGPTLYDAARLNERVVQAMEAAPDVLDSLAACVLNADYSYPDAVRKLHRYQAVFELIYY